MVVEYIGLGVAAIIAGVLLYKILQKAISLAIKLLIVLLLLSGIYFFLSQSGILGELSNPLIISLI